MLLDKSTLTSIYFTTFEKKRKVKSPLPHTTKLFGFWYNFTFFDYMSTKSQIFKFCQFSPSIFISISFNKFFGETQSKLLKPKILQFHIHKGTHFFSSIEFINYKQS